MKIIIPKNKIKIIIPNRTASDRGRANFSQSPETGLLKSFAIENDAGFWKVMNQLFRCESNEEVVGFILEGELMTAKINTLPEKADGPRKKVRKNP